MILKNFFVIIYAEDAKSADLLMKREFGLRWADIYERNKFEKKYFPKGCIRVLGVKTALDELEDKLEWIYEQRIYNREIEREGNTDNKLLP